MASRFTVNRSNVLSGGLHYLGLPSLDLLIYSLEWSPPIRSQVEAQAQHQDSWSLGGKLPGHSTSAVSISRFALPRNLFKLAPKLIKIATQN